jgi:Gene product 88
MTQTLSRSSDRKVAFGVTPGGNVSVRNAFGLPAGKAYSCPGATDTCESVCYAGKIENQYKAVFAMLNNNFTLLRNASVIGQFRLLDTMIAEFVAECDRKNVVKAFRIHWDGDFFAIGYAMAWAAIARKYSNVQFWVYTRSFVPALNVIPFIAGIPNLAVYLSVDHDNEEFAADILAEFPDVMVSVLSDTMENAAVITKELTGKPGAKCPELIKAIPLISADGGACAACGLCPFGKAPIRFAHTSAGRK